MLTLVQGSKIAAAPAAANRCTERWGGAGRAAGGEQVFV